MDDRLNMFGRLCDRLLGMRSFGPVTLYSWEGAMAGQIQLYTRRWGYVCFGWPRIGRTWDPKGLGPYLYVSPNATPWAATFLAGRRFPCGERRMAGVRRALFGHGYSTDPYDQEALDALANESERLTRLQAIARG